MLLTAAGTLVAGSGLGFLGGRSWAPAAPDVQRKRVTTPTALAGLAVGPLAELLRASPTYLSLLVQHEQVADAEWFGVARLTTAALEDHPDAPASLARGLLRFARARDGIPGPIRQGLDLLAQRTR